MRLRPLATLLAALAALTIFAAGCGGDDETTSSTPASTTEEATGPSGASGEEGASASGVAMSEYAFAPADLTVASGDSIEVTNDGEIPHNLTIEEAGVATSDLDGGASEELVVEADPGEYEYICTIADHADLGMTGTITVE